MRGKARLGGAAKAPAKKENHPAACKRVPNRVEERRLKKTPKDGTGADNQQTPQGEPRRRTGRVGEGAASERGAAGLQMELLYAAPNDDLKETNNGENLTRVGQRENETPTPCAQERRARGLAKEQKNTGTKRKTPPPADSETKEGRVEESQRKPSGESTKACLKMRR
eukprot:CAMPEP_0182866690 /NCGR_PEP_ID=MMETSP0034_2-20130328/8327_1 /TAXON_ID=156128 /ORGANISM="Nephroselmis pyriformis, Strain CCMP717" /LENGTH=167 /DNA_ID=CAMNT_0024999019 /DNA_START=1697 /DNA_END=2200 /DNA_ORIENTATION=+